MDDGHGVCGGGSCGGDVIGVDALIAGQDTLRGSVHGSVVLVVVVVVVMMLVVVMLLELTGTISDCCPASLLSTRTTRL